MLLIILVEEPKNVCLDFNWIKKDHKHWFLREAESRLQSETSCQPFIQEQNYKIQCCRSPLWCGISTVEWILELNNISILLLQLPMMLHVILHQLCKSGKLLPSVQVVVVSCVLDLDVGDGSISSAEKQLFRDVLPSGAEDDRNISEEMVQHKKQKEHWRLF